MINLKILSAYLFRLYCSYFIGILFIIIGILILSNIFDLLHKFKAVYIPLHYFGKLIFFKIPYLLNEISSLISFIAMLFFLKRLTKHNELLLILSNGVHIWKVIFIPAIAAIIFGIILIAIFNPIGTLGLQKYEQLEAKLTKKNSYNLKVSKSGLIFLEKDTNTKKILQTKAIDIVNNKLLNITLLLLDNNNNFLERIDGSYAFLTNNNLEIISAKIYDGENFKNYAQFNVATNLSIKKLLDNFINPEMISIWDLPGAIKQLTETGVPITNYQIYYYKQLFKPIIMATMVLLASCFFSLRQHDHSAAKALILGLFIGFLTYFILEISFKMFSYNGVPPLLAVLLPNIGILLLSNFIIMPSQHASSG